MPTPTPYPTLPAEPVLTMADAYNGFQMIASNFPYIWPMLYFTAGIVVLLVVVSVISIIQQNKGD